ncbi:hypothetical protein B9Z65_3643 [Elsinoe australis]|uniref:Uncharacterized protein n=1 Tax=Elsinoe australis TaxID=40998 RepID=A0A2P8AFR7_9PEZI|nr:hypothetical protein B9Z65_3643 [Elsinoe australis]
MSLSMRTYDSPVRETVLDAVKRVIVSECEASESPRPPFIDMVRELGPVINNEDLIERLRLSFEDAFAGEVKVMDRSTSCEDFPYLALNSIPYVYWNLGCINHNLWYKMKSNNKLEEMLSHHSSKFAPDLYSSLERGIDALVVAALSSILKTWINTTPTTAIDGQ